MLALLEVVIPVFLVTAAGYAAVRLRYFTDAHIDGMNRYAIALAVPALLFNAAMEMDLATAFDPRPLISFYVGNTTAFAIGLLGARVIFRRRPGEAVAIAFGALFSNSVIIGVPIVDRAFGADALTASFAIITLHAPFCYLLGITVMEISRADGRSARETAKAVANAMLRNALMIGLGLGFAINIAGITLPGTFTAALDLVVASALPVALFALGGVLTRYRLSATLGEAAMVAFLSLVLHPGITFFLAHVVFDLPRNFVQGAVLTAAMAPGVNAYIFASMYKRAEDVAASAVLLGTVASVLSIWVWLLVLNGI